MNRAPILIPALLLLIVGCSKDKYATKPSLEIKSINTLIPVQGELDAVLTYTSKKGDLGQGTFVAIRQRLNQRPVPLPLQNTDTFTGAIPSYPDQQSAQLEFKLGWATGLHESDISDPDTFVFKFAVIDRAKISSDTITSPKIIVISQ